MEEIARVYSEALFGAAKDAGKLDEVREQLGEFADALNEDRNLQIFLFSPYFSSEEKKDGVKRIVSDADERMLNFLELLAERHRMPAIFRIRDRFEELWAEENKQLEVELISAVELDPELVKRVGEEIGRRTGRKVELSSEVDEGVLGGLVLRVGNKVLDASIRSKLEKLRREVAKAT